MALRSSLSAVALVLVAVAIAAHLRFVDPSEVADLKPRPDALEYEEAARSIVRGDGYWLGIGEAKYPPRYPPGMSLLVAASSPAFGVARGAGVRTVLACALLTVLVAAALAWRLGGGWPAAAAALLLAIAPLHVVWSKHVMSDVPSALLVTIVAAWLVVDAARARSTLRTLARAALVGLSVGVRTANVALLPALAVAELWCAAGRRASPGATGRRRARVATGLALAAGFAVGLAPLLLYNGVRFGAPWRSGYDLWHGAEFDLGHALRSPLATGSGNLRFYATALAGLGDLYAWPLALGVVLGALVLWRGRPAGRALLAFVALLVAALLAIYVPFFWQDTRFLLPALPLLLVVAAQGTAASSPRLVRGLTWACIVATAAIAWRAPERYALPYDARAETDHLRAIAGVIEPDAVLVMRTGVFPFADVVRTPGTDRLWVPVGRCPHLRMIERYGIVAADDAPLPSWLLLDVVEAPFDGAQAAARLEEVVRTGRPVYFATSPRDFEVPYAGRLRTVVEEAFDLRPVLRHRDWELFRLSAKAA